MYRTSSWPYGGAARLPALLALVGRVTAATVGTITGHTPRRHTHPPQTPLWELAVDEAAAAGRVAALQSLVGRAAALQRGTHRNKCRRLRLFAKMLRT